MYRQWQIGMNSNNEIKFVSHSVFSHMLLHGMYRGRHSKPLSVLLFVAWIHGAAIADLIN